MEHIPEKDFVVADALSSQPLKSEDSLCIAEEVREFERAFIQHLSVSNVCLEQPSAVQDKDLVISILKKCITEGWPKSKPITSQDRPTILEV